MRASPTRWPGTALGIATVLTVGCGTLHPEVTSLGEVSSDRVVVVGRVELVPPLQSGEQVLRMGTFDPLDAAGKLRDRAVLHLAKDAKPMEETWEVINPRLDQTFFFRIPKEKRFVVFGTITTSYEARIASRRHVNVDTTEILLPRMVFDITPEDKAIYVGTIRLHRDEFNSITKVEILDHYPAASVEFKKRFGSGVELRKSITKPLLQ